MKRLHVHVAVADLGTAMDFYRTLFGAEPCVVENDYAKWMLDDPRVNFAISSRGRKVGLDHLGIQVDDDAELDNMSAALRASGQRTIEQRATTCCYAEGNKAWVADPSGILWETFHTIGAATVYGADNAEADALAGAGACCAPSMEPAAGVLPASGCCAPDATRG